MYNVGLLPFYHLLKRIQKDALNKRRVLSIQSVIALIHYCFLLLSLVFPIMTSLFFKIFIIFHKHILPVKIGVNNLCRQPYASVSMLF